MNTINVSKAYPLYTPTNNGEELTKPTVFLTRKKGLDSFVPRRYFPDEKIWKELNDSALYGEVEDFMESATVEDVKNSHIKSIEDDVQIALKAIKQLDVITKRFAYVQGKLIELTDIDIVKLRKELAEIK